MTNNEITHHKSIVKALQPACFRSVIYITQHSEIQFALPKKGVKSECFCFQNACQSLMMSVVPPPQGTFIFSVVIYQPLKFNKIYIYPTWAYALGWFLGLFCVLVVPLWVIFKLFQMKGTVWQVCARKNTCKSQYLS